MGFCVSANRAFLLILLASAPAFAQTNVLTNGSFEPDLTGWTTGTRLQATAAGTCGYNGATSAGTETITGTPAFLPTDLTHLAMGYVADTANNGAIITCALYQDVAIPAGATTATFTFDIGLKDLQNTPSRAAVRVGIYSSTGGTPNFSDPTQVGPFVGYSVGSADGNLQPDRSSGSFNISSVAGTTVRFAILNAANGGGGVGLGGSGHEVIGIDNIRFLVNVGTPTPVPTLSQWSLAGLALLLGGTGFHLLHRRTSQRASAC